MSDEKKSGSESAKSDQINTHKQRLLKDAADATTRYWTANQGERDGNGFYDGFLAGAEWKSRNALQLNMCNSEKNSQETPRPSGDGGSIPASSAEVAAGDPSRDERSVEGKHRPSSGPELDALQSPAAASVATTDCYLCEPAYLCAVHKRGAEESRTDNYWTDIVQTTRNTLAIAFTGGGGPEFYVKDCIRMLDQLLSGAGYASPQSEESRGGDSALSNHPPGAAEVARPVEQDTQLKRYREALEHVKALVNEQECRGDEDCDHCLIVYHVIEDALAKCEACGKPGVVLYDSNGEGLYWLCERTDGDHDQDHYCGTEVRRVAQHDKKEGK